MKVQIQVLDAKLINRASGNVIHTTPVCPLPSLPEPNDGRTSIVPPVDDIGFAVEAAPDSSQHPKLAVIGPEHRCDEVVCLIKYHPPILHDQVYFSFGLERWFFHFEGKKRLDEKSKFVNRRMFSEELQARNFLAEIVSFVNGGKPKGEPPEVPLTHLPKRYQSKIAFLKGMQRDEPKRYGEYQKQIDDLLELANEAAKEQREEGQPTHLQKQNAELQQAEALKKLLRTLFPDLHRVVEDAKTSGASVKEYLSQYDAQVLEQISSGYVAEVRIDRRLYCIEKWDQWTTVKAQKQAREFNQKVVHALLIDCKRLNIPCPFDYRLGTGDEDDELILRLGKAVKATSPKKATEIYTVLNWVAKKFFNMHRKDWVPKVNDATGESETVENLGHQIADTYGLKSRKGRPAKGW